MPSNFSGLTVTWLDETDTYATTANITSDVIQIPLFTDTGSGEVNEAEITISAKDGKHISSGSSVFDKFDRIRIQITDLGSNSYDRYYEITDILPGQTKDSGSIITLSCLGIEYHTQVIHYARRDWFENAFDVISKIAIAYNENIGTRQPTIFQHLSVYSTGTSIGNGLPGFTNNHYEFGTNEENCYNRFMDVNDLLGGGVGSGGVGEFFELGFDTPTEAQLDLAVFVSGARTFDGNDPVNDASAVLIENTTLINVSDQDGGISNPTGTKVGAWGSPVHGSLPTGTEKYRGHELEFIFRPEWRSGVNYKIDAKVIFTNAKHYIALSDHLSSGSNDPTDGTGDWLLIDMSSEFGDTIQYSEWTDDKAKLWANAGCNPDAVSATPAWSSASVSYTIGDLVTFSGSSYVALTVHTSSLSNEPTDNTGDWEMVDFELVGNGAAFFDTNISVRDDGIMFRTWVQEVVGDTDYNGVTDQGLSSEYRHLTQDAVPQGHRILNVNNIFLSGNDLRGRSFGDAVINWTNQRKVGDQGIYEVIYVKPTVKLDKTQVADIKDRKIWEWDDTTSKWEDKTSTSNIFTAERNDDCFHEWKSIYNIAGSDPRVTTQSTTPFNEDANDFATNIRSAVEVAYSFGDITRDFIGVSADAQKGAWLNFAFPFPTSTYNSIAEGVGDIYGGGTNEQSSGVTQPSLLDTQNMTWTSDGRIGFNHATSEELGKISSVSFNMRIQINNIAGIVLGGAATIRCAIYDIKDNVSFQDFEIRFTDGISWQAVNLPLAGFTTTRGRTPKNWALRWGATILGIEIPIQELDIQDVFEEHNIKYISFQIQDFYDEEGRYDPNNDMLEVTNTGGFTSGGGYIRMAIDAFHFKKRLLAITGQPSVQNIEPKFLQRPNIISYIQLLNEAKTQLEIEQFRHKEFNFQTSGNNIFDIRFGDTFFLKNTDLINDDSRNETTLGAGDGEVGTIRLVAKRIEYHLSVPENGPGGITRSIKGIRRFTI